MPRRPVNLSLRQALIGVALLALAAGLWREVRRIKAFDGAARIFAFDAERFRRTSERLRQQGQHDEAAAVAQDAEDAQAASDWYRSHRLWGGQRPLRRRYEFRRGWPLETAFQRAPTVVVATVEGLDLRAQSTTFAIETVLKGDAAVTGSITVGTQYVPDQAACLVRGETVLVFCGQDPRGQLVASRLAEDTEANRLLLAPLVAQEAGSVGAIPAPASMR